jgi:hypothetical protein
MRFAFLGADVANEICISDFAVLGNLGLGDEYDCAGAFDLFVIGTAGSDSMGEQCATWSMSW